MKELDIIVIGRPASGKSTIARRIVELLRAEGYNVGDLNDTFDDDPATDWAARANGLKAGLRISVSALAANRPSL